MRLKTLLLAIAYGLFLLGMAYLIDLRGLDEDNQVKAFMACMYGVYVVVHFKRMVRR